MQRVPVFIEMPNPDAKPEALVCQLTLKALAGMGYEELPLAHSLEDLNAQLALMADQSKTPALFVLNTFNARDIIPQLDPIVGETPMIFLRRNMYAGKSGLSEHFDIGASTGATMTAMRNMKPRLAAVWNYGSMNGPEIARTVARAIDGYLKTNDFHAVERQSTLIKTRL